MPRDVAPIQIRVDEPTKHAWQDAADREGVKLSEFIRRAVWARVAVEQATGPLRLSVVTTPEQGKRSYTPDPKPVRKQK